MSFSIRSTLRTVHTLHNPANTRIISNEHADYITVRAKLIWGLVLEMYYSKKHMRTSSQPFETLIDIWKYSGNSSWNKTKACSRRVGVLHVDYLSKAVVKITHSQAHSMFTKSRSLSLKSSHLVSWHKGDRPWERFLVDVLSTVPNLHAH